MYKVFATVAIYISIFVFAEWRDRINRKRKTRTTLGDCSYCLNEYHFGPCYCGSCKKWHDDICFMKCRNWGIGLIVVGLLVYLLSDGDYIVE